MSYNSKNTHTYLRISKLEIYKNDIRVRYTSDVKKDPPESNKKAITELTRKSLSKMVFYANNSAVELKGMITLTYPSVFPRDGKESKKHLNRFLTSIRTVVSFDYIWFLEFQRRGAPHYHIITSIDPTPFMGEVAIRWYRAVGSNDIKHLMAGTRCEALRKREGAARYAAKYAGKLKQKEVPKDYQNCGRFWGNSRGVVPSPKEVINFKGGTVDELKTLLDGVGWEYVQSLDKPLTILYNAGKLF